MLRLMLDLASAAGLRPVNKPSELAPAPFAIQGEHAVSLESPVVKNYFEHEYPQRSSWVAPVFRSGELKRATMMADWLRPLRGTTLCDVGCGDGEQLER